MYRIIGLWNDDPKEGEKYQDTPHNIGGQILAELYRKKSNNFLKNCSGLFFSKTRNAKISEGFLVNEKDLSVDGTAQEEEINFEIILPQTFINNSGDAFNRVFQNENKKDLVQSVIEIGKIIVIYDDIALPFGKIKISYARGDGGHNGIKDITKKLGTKNYIRIRVGVCPLDFFGKCRKPKGASVAKYLTKKRFSGKQIKMLPDMEEETGKILEYILKNGYKKAMNEFN